MLVLGIETSCDETAAALVEDGKVLSSEVSSSVELHSEYGGVVPEIASRYHIEYISRVYEKAMKDARRGLEDVDLISVTKGPGLSGSLLVGIAFAKALALAAGKPLVGVNHLKAHLFSPFLNADQGGGRAEECFPFLGMVVSGGHTNLYHSRGIDEIELLGQTLDDAVGEAYDKVAKILALGYPGGPVLEKRASRFDGRDVIGFPRALAVGESGMDFSFSGIKTAVLYHWRDSVKSEREKDRISFSFQEAVIDVIIRKLAAAVRKTGARTVAVGGGVVNNTALRGRLEEMCAGEHVRLLLPEKEYCTDNAAMVAFLGGLLYGKGCFTQRSDLFLNAEQFAEI